MDTQKINIREIFSEVFGVDKDKITLNTDNSNLREWDSLSHVSLIVKLEGKLNIRLEAVEIARMISVKEVINILRKKTNITDFGL